MTSISARWGSIRESGNPQNQPTIVNVNQLQFRWLLATPPLVLLDRVRNLLQIKGNAMLNTDQNHFNLTWKAVQSPTYSVSAVTKNWKSVLFCYFYIGNVGPSARCGLHRSADWERIAVCTIHEHPRRSPLERLNWSILTGRRGQLVASLYCTRPLQCPILHFFILPTSSMSSMNSVPTHDGTSSRPSIGLPDISYPNLFVPSRFVPRSLSNRGANISSSCNPKL